MPKDVELSVPLPGIQLLSAASGASPPRWRWAMLAILSLDICVSYLPYYTFVPIQPQSMEVYGVGEEDLNVLCILYALVYVPCAFLTGPFTGSLGCRWTFVFAMVLTTGGCALRCGPEHVLYYFQTPDYTGDLSPYQLFGSGLPAETGAQPQRLPFQWLVIGQALCALGQPFLVNSTSQMGAEWFPPHERPAAAMVSNLMNFVGSSLSFMLPPCIVDVSAGDLQATTEQVTDLMVLQFKCALVSCILTGLLYQSAPPVPVLAAHRAPVSFAAEVRRFVCLRDFWLVNGQFMIYVTVCHAFDAVEGSLFQRYGYSAALSSYTAVSCSIAAILSTLVESVYIANPASYQPALIAINLLLAASLALAFICLYFQLHEAGIVMAVGVMGLSTPGWGCTFELGSEVCFPAREATISSLLEACSNLLGVVGIVAAQRLIDAGLGAGVLVLMSLCTLLGGGLLLGLSGRLRRTEAEAMAEIEMEAKS